MLGQAYLEAERFAAADAALAVAAAERPDLPPLAFLRAELCYRLGRGEATAQRLAAVQQLAPDWEAPLLRAGTLALDQERFAEAAAPFERALELNPSNAEAALLLAVAYQRTERPEDGLAVLEAALESSPDDMQLLLALAERYDRLSRWAELREIADRILAQVPGHPVAEYRLAKLAELEGDTEAAMPHAVAAVSGFARTPLTLPGVRPTDVWAIGSPLIAETRRLLADLRNRSGQPEVAQYNAIQLVEDFPLYPDGHFLLGNILLRGRDETGRAHLDRFKALTDARVHADLANNYASTGQYELALAEYERARAIVDDDPTTMVGQAAALQRLGRAAEALPLLEAARTVGSEPGAWYGAYVLTLSSLGRSEDAQVAWAEAAQLELELDFGVRNAIYADVAACQENRRRALSGNVRRARAPARLRTCLSGRP